MKGNDFKPGRERAVRLLLTMSLMSFFASCVYMKMNPPPDVNKADHGHDTEETLTCWLANAANMLAGAGYGTGNTVRYRADTIYKQMASEFAVDQNHIPSGWTDAAIEWWIGSANNRWPDNPYKYVDIVGYKDPKPWENAYGPRIIGNLLRKCAFVGTSIEMVEGVMEGGWGHAITVWGDEIYSPNDSMLNTNPRTVRVTDSEPYKERLIQDYSYDAYENPNPEGTNEGPGWYINYFQTTHPYIKHIIVLHPVDRTNLQDPVKKVIGSYSIHQTSRQDATDLHYKILSDTEILSYNTIITSTTENDPTIIESKPERKELDVTWDLSDAPVPECNWVVITTELILPNNAAMEYSDVHFTYQTSARTDAFPWLLWQLQTQPLENAEAIPNVTGGYVIGSFDICEGPEPIPDQAPIAKYRFIHRYPYNKSPDKHQFVLSGKEGFHIENVRFGHSYGILDSEELWEFEDWNTEISPDTYSLGKDPIQIPIIWERKLTYPRGETSTGKIPIIK